jgi:polysaccharide biosynthesis/export protein
MPKLGIRWGVLPLLFVFAALCAPVSRAQQAQASDYTLNPGDVLEVSIWKEPDLTKTVMVRPDGKFSVPLAGEIQAVGRSVPQVQTEIASKLVKYIPDPVVTVSLA